MRAWGRLLRSVSPRALVARGLQAAVLLSLLSAALFALLSALPTNSVDLLIASNPHLSPDDVIRLKRLKGLDRPLWVQYRRWLLGAPGMHPLPKVLPLPPLVAPDEGPAIVGVEDRLIGTSGWRDAEAFLEAYARIDAKSAEEIGAAPLVRRALTKDDGLIEAIRLARGRHPIAVGALVDEVRETSRNNLRVACLTDGCRLTTSPGGRSLELLPNGRARRHFFSVTDLQGLSAIGSVVVLPPPASASNAPRPANDDTAVEDAAPPDVAAPAAQWAPIPPLVLDGTRPQSRPLAPFLERGPSLTVRFSLPPVDDARVQSLSLSPDGILKVTAAPDARGTLVVNVHARVGREEDEGFAEELHAAALVIDFGPVVDPLRSESGVVHALVFDRSSLGYSSAFGQPVYDLLFGAPDRCGDRRVTGNEACDDGNIDDGDGCSATCSQEGESFRAAFERNATAFLRQPGRLWNTLLLMLPALLLSLLLALPLGVVAAYRRGVLDHTLNGGAFVAMSMPVFWLGLMVVALFAEEWQLLPASGAMSADTEGDLWTHIGDRIRHLVLPVSVLVAVYTGRWMRYVRGAVTDVLPLDYVRTARAKGLSETCVLFGHVLRNALVPVVTIVSLSLPSLFGGALLTETVFSWPGLGSLQFEAVIKGDLYLAIVIFLLLAALTFAANAIADAAYAVVDPRTRSPHDEGGR